MSDVENAKDAIKTAIQMEKDGFSFYQKAATQTSNNMGKTVFKSLAADELLHLEVFQKLFEEKIGRKEWYNLLNTSNKYAEIQFFPKDLHRIDGAKPDTNEIDALKIALDSEKRAIEFYTKILEDISDDDIKEIIDEIINQEKNHFQILQGEYNYLNKTGNWFNLDYLESY